MIAEDIGVYPQFTGQSLVVLEASFHEVLGTVSILYHMHYRPKHLIFCSPAHGVLSVQLYTFRANFYFILFF